MEKVTVRIGKIGPCSGYAREFPKNCESKDVQWLSETFEISVKRANKILQAMKEYDPSNQTSNYLVVDLSYRQLARYTAKRQVEDLNKYWKYPLVLEHIEGKEERGDELKPIELRPGCREVPFRCR